MQRARGDAAQTPPRCFLPVGRRLVFAACVSLFPSLVLPDSRLLVSGWYDASLTFGVAAERMLVHCSREKRRVAASGQPTQRRPALTSPQLFIRPARRRLAGQGS